MTEFLHEQGEPPADEPAETPSEPVSPDEEQTTEEPDESPDGAEEPSEAPPEGLSETDFEKTMGRLEKESARHSNRVSEIMGEDAQGLEPCPRCLPNIPGFIWPIDVAPLPPDVLAAVKLSIGEAPEPEYERADNARQCDACHGHGKRLSGSLVPDQRVLLCASCTGRGWIAVGGPAAPAPVNGHQAQPADEPVVAGEDKPLVDPWNRTADDPNYGRLPQYVS